MPIHVNGRVSEGSRSVDSQMSEEIMKISQVARRGIKGCKRDAPVAALILLNASSKFCTLSSVAWTSTLS